MLYQSNPGFRLAILGRPNVGKSTLFNFLTRSRKAVVKNQEGVTRDTLVGTANWWGHSFEVLDTGGLTQRKDHFSPLVYKQVKGVLSFVDLLVVVMDGKQGLMPEDRDVIKVAKESGKPFFLVINKVDQERDAELLKSDFYELGLEALHASFEKRDHTDKIVEKIIQYIPESNVPESTGIRVAILGKPNAGKSSLFNSLLGRDRVLISKVAGTTVDPVEEVIRYQEQTIVFVDTAGLRRQSKRLSRGDRVELVSTIKSQETMRKSDLVLLVIDALEGATEQDAKIIELAYSEHKPLIVVANKWDIAKKEHEQPRKRFKDNFFRKMHFAPDIPIVFVSALTKYGLEAILTKTLSVWSSMNQKISTRELNDFFYNVIRKTPSPVYGVKDVKFYYLTQTEQKPPAFIAFANHPQGVTPAYRRFLTKQIQSKWGLGGIPVRVFVMKS